MTDTNTGYNGWKNRQTWNVALWFGNDYGLYTRAKEARAQFIRMGWKSGFNAARAKALVTAAFQTGKTPDGDELVGVNWAEIASAFNKF